MTLRGAIEKTTSLLKKGDLKNAKIYLARAESHLKQRDPSGKIRMPFICCFVMDNKTGLIYCCDKDDPKPRFPGTEKERINLCQKCRQWCRQKIEELKNELAQREKTRKKRANSRRKSKAQIAAEQKTLDLLYAYYYPDA